MNDLTRYLAVRRHMAAGDVIAFEGTGLISGAIEMLGGSVVSHVGLVRTGAVATDDARMTESTIRGNQCGARSCYLADRLGNYDGAGRAWWLPLSDEARRVFNVFEFYKAIGEYEDRIQYDVKGLFLWIARLLPVLGTRIAQDENRARMYCSAYAIALFERANLLRGINYSKSTPQDLVDMRIYRECVQVLGEPRALDRFNKV